MQPANHHLISPQAFDRKVQLLREVAAKLALAVQTCSLHRHIADMSILIQDLASSGDDAGTIDVGSSVVHLAQALQDSAAAESQVLYPLTSQPLFPFTCSTGMTAWSGNIIWSLRFQFAAIQPLPPANAS